MRIPLFPNDDMTPEQERVMGNIVGGPRGKIVGPFRASLHRPELTDAWQRFGQMLRFESSVPRHLNELAISVTGRRWNSQVEWYAHAKAALDFGISPDILEAIRVGESPVFDDEDEANVYEFTRLLLQEGNVPDDLYAALHATLGDGGMVDLSTVIGYYTMVSMTLNVHEVGLPDNLADVIAPIPGPALPELPPARRA